MISKAWCTTPAYYQAPQPYKSGEGNEYKGGAAGQRDREFFLITIPGSVHV